MSVDVPTQNCPECVSVCVCVPDTAELSGKRSRVPAWSALVVGSVALGVGVGCLLASGLGASPLDAFFSAVASLSGVGISVVIFAVSVIFVLAAWALGVRPGPGTFVAAALSAVVVEVTLGVVSGPGWVLWGLGAVLVGVSVAFLVSSGLGASPYDQVVCCVAKHTSLPVPFSRAVVDFTAGVAAFALGGPVALGTVAALIVVPLVVAAVLPPVRAFVHGRP